MSTVTTKPKTVKAKDQASFPVQLIALANLQPSKTNPRKRFADASLRELANSIKRVGVLQAIVVRPLRTKVKLTKDVTVTEVTGRYEIVAGERRWRAAKLAGLTEIPATVRDLNDMEALEVQRIENLQRQDLDPVEEARGYKEMITEHNYTVEGLAAALAKSKAYVYGVLKLADLPPKAEEALVDGVI